MTILDPTKTSVGDLCGAALKESGAYGTGQTPSSEDITDAWARMQWMLQQWERKRWLVYHLVTFTLVSTGATQYSVGPGGDFDTNAGREPFGPAFGPAFGSGSAVSVRPNKIESAFLTQLTAAPNLVDFPLRILPSMEDYNRIRLKGLVSFPGWVFYDPAWPLGILKPWPIPQASIYSVNFTIKEQLPVRFVNLATTLNLPFEYYGAIVYNLAMRIRPRFGIRSKPGDDLPAMAKDALEVLRNANVANATLEMPTELQRPGLYDIFGDNFY